MVLMPRGPRRYAGAFLLWSVGAIAILRLCRRIAGLGTYLSQIFN